MEELSRPERQVYASRNGAEMDC